MARGRQLLTPGFWKILVNMYKIRLWPTPILVHCLPLSWFSLDVVWFSLFCASLEFINFVDLGKKMKRTRSVKKKGWVEKKVNWILLLKYTWCIDPLSIKIKKIVVGSHWTRAMKSCLGHGNYILFEPSHQSR